jgi:chitin disaccharide deacetylase
MDASRCLVVVADDYGIGPETSRAILELAGRGVVTGAVLLVNSPYASDDVRKWRQSGLPLELGWHPSLTLDPPLAPLARVASLVGPDGCLWPLGQFVPRLLLGWIKPNEIEAELQAQYKRFLELVGHPPTLVNSHQHTAIFPPVGQILLEVLSQGPTKPYMRRVREPWSMLKHIPGARIKRGLLSLLGRHHAQAQDRLGFPGHDWLAGITDPRWVTDAEFFPRWLSRVPGRVVELACHPGHYDATLIGRDCGANDGLLQRRVDELKLLNLPSFGEAIKAAGFRLVAPSDLIAQAGRGLGNAA